MTPEGRLKTKIRKYLSSRGIYWTNVVPAMSVARGVPDIIACYQGIFLGIEGKTYCGTQSPAQKVQQSRIEASGGVYIIARSLDDVKEALDYIDALTEWS